MKSIFFMSLLFACTVVTTSLFAAWTVPTSAPSSATNTPSPINISSLDQTKEGGLAVKTLMVDNAVLVQGGNTTAAATGAVSLQVDGSLGSAQFCSELGTDCFTAAEMNTLILGL